MSRYYVEFRTSDDTAKNQVLYVFAYSEQQVRHMFWEYEVVACDITE